MTRLEPLRADTFELQAKRTADGTFQSQREELEFDGLAEEDGDIYDEENDDDDDGDALSSSPSIPDEDIDFDFMYALHSFAATVEGQANATKGDMLVLLDDSNSYWWLVRVVRDHTVGYLPAETIETPQERLARLNKHRNIDLTAVMLEDHSPTSRSSSRKPFRRKGAKSVAFNTSCTYYELDNSYDSSDAEEEGEDSEAVIANGQIVGSDHLASEEADSSEENAIALLRERDDVSEINELIDNELDHPSPRIGIETVDLSDRAGRKVMHIKSLNERVGERPTSAIFRDSQLEPLKFSVTPSIARDQPLTSPVESHEMASLNKSKPSDRDREFRKRSLSASSTVNSDSSTESELRERERERDKKGRKNSVFGNLFRKRSRKSSKDDIAREDDVTENFVRHIATAAIGQEPNGDDYSLSEDPFQAKEEAGVAVVEHATPNGPSWDGTNKRTLPTEAIKGSELHLETPPDSPAVDMDIQASPATPAASSSLETHPSLPWSDSSIHSFLDNDTSIRDALVLVYEGSRLIKPVSTDAINPLIADLYGVCTLHIEEMSSHLDNVLVSYLFDMKA